MATSYVFCVCVFSVNECVALCASPERTLYILRGFVFSPHELYVSGDGCDVFVQCGASAKDVLNYLLPHLSFHRRC